MRCRVIAKASSIHGVHGHDGKDRCHSLAPLNVMLFTEGVSGIGEYSHGLGWGVDLGARFGAAPGGAALPSPTDRPLTGGARSGGPDLYCDIPAYNCRNAAACLRSCTPQDEYPSCPPARPSASPRLAGRMLL